MQSPLVNARAGCFLAVGADITAQIQTSRKWDSCPALSALVHMTSIFCRPSCFTTYSTNLHLFWVASNNTIYAEPTWGNFAEKPHKMCKASLDMYVRLWHDPWKRKQHHFVSKIVLQKSPVAQKSSVARLFRCLQWADNTLGLQFYIIGILRFERADLSLSARKGVIRTANDIRARQKWADVIIPGVKDITCHSGWAIARISPGSPAPDPIYESVQDKSILLIWTAVCKSNTGALQDIGMPTTCGRVSILLIL